LVAEYNEQVKKKGENKAVKGVDETEHDKTGCMGRKDGVEGYKARAHLPSLCVLITEKANS
jgi:hypothetical protein